MHRTGRQRQEGGTRGPQVGCRPAPRAPCWRGVRRRRDRGFTKRDLGTHLEPVDGRQTRPRWRRPVRSRRPPPCASGAHRRRARIHRLQSLLREGHHGPQAREDAILVWTCRLDGMIRVEFPGQNQPMKTFKWLTVLALLSAMNGATSVRTASSPVAGILQSELQRNMQVLKQQPVPAYFGAYTVFDEKSTQILAAFGAIVRSEQDHQRFATVEVRVGDYVLDNTHPIRGDARAMSNRLA